MGVSFVLRRLGWREEAVHPPRGMVKEECYLGRGVDVLNVYERCGHACCYCYAEWPWSPGNVVVRVNVVERARRDLAKRYLGRRVVINLGSAIDPYQPVESKFELTRKVIELLMKFNASFYICTKSRLVCRDLDLLSKYENCWVGVTVTSLNPDFQRVFEPYAASPEERLRVIERLVEAGVMVVARISPIIPEVNDSLEELRRLVGELKSVGVQHFTADVLKLDRRGYVFYGWSGMPKWKRPLIMALEEWGGSRLVGRIAEMYYRDGEVLYGYVVPRETERFRILSAVREFCGDAKFTTCNMGVEIKRRLTNWVGKSGKYMCACYAREPTEIRLSGKHKFSHG